MKRIMRTVAASLGVALFAALAAAPAHAEEANGLGQKGQLIVTADRLLPILGYSRESVTTTQNGVDTTSSDSGTSLALLVGREPRVAVNPHTVPRLALDYSFGHLTVGGSVVLAFGLGGSLTTETGNNSQKQDAPKASLVGFAPRVGYVLPLGDHFAFWPRAGFAFYSISQKIETRANNGAVGTATDTDSLWSVDLDPQLTWVPIPHFFLHGGPLVNIPLTGSRSHETVTGNVTATTKSDLAAFHVGLSAGLGGWFDL